MDHQTTEDEFSFKSLFVPFTTSKAVKWIIAIGLLVFFNSLFNGFVFDDNGQILANPSVHTITSIPGLFLNQVIAQQVSNYYRPLPLSIYAILYSFFGSSAFSYHLIQVIFHIGNSILVFFVFKKFLKIQLAFFLSLIFLVHPIDEETTVYIANLQDVLLLFFGLLSLYFVEKSTKLKYILLANIFLLFSLFSKETGILFLVMTDLYLVFFKKTKLLLQIAFSIIVFIVYFMMRSLSPISLQKQALIPIMRLSFWNRMIQVPLIIYYYLKTFFFPVELVSLHTWVINKIQFGNFFLPLAIDFLFFGILLIISLYVYKREEHKKLIAFFLLWFVLGLVIHLQILPLDYTVADHYFYFPMIGLLALFGLFLNTLTLSMQAKQISLVIGISLLSILSLRTMERNTNWINQSVLVSHDERIENNDYLLELLYSTNLAEHNKNDEALPHMQKAISLYSQSAIAWSTLGVIYYQKGDILSAKHAFSRSMSVGNYYGAYENMALLLLDHEDIYKARKFIVDNSNKFPNSVKLWYYRILADYKVKDYKDALYAAKQYYFIKQDKESYTILYYIQNRLPIKLED